jgi:hypothetical protein
MSHILNDSYIGSKNIYLKSQEASISISDAHKIFYLNNPITPPSNIRIMLGCHNFECPNSLYNINTTNNILNVSAEGNDVSITIPVGNYDSDTFAVKITQLLAGEYDNLGDTLIVCEFNNDNYIFEFSSNNPFSIISTTADVELGLLGQTPTPLGSNYICENVCNLAGISGIFIKIKNLGFNNLDSYGDITNTIARCDVNVNFGEYIFYSPAEVLYFAINDKNIQYLEVQLTDDEGNEIQLNGGRWSLVLSAHFSYEKEVKLPSNSSNFGLSNIQLEDLKKKFSKK